MKFDHSIFGHSSGWIDIEEWFDFKLTDEQHIDMSNGEIVRQIYAKDNMTVICVARKLSIVGIDWNFTYGVTEDTSTIYVSNELDGLIKFIRNYKNLYWNVNF